MRDFSTGKPTWCQFREALAGTHWSLRCAGSLTDSLTCNCWVIVFTLPGINNFLSEFSSLPLSQILCWPLDLLIIVFWLSSWESITLFFFTTFCTCVRVCVCVYPWRAEDNLKEYVFSSSTKCFLGIELRLQNLVVGVSTHWAVLPGLRGSITLDDFEASSPVPNHMECDKECASLWCS